LENGSCLGAGGWYHWGRKRWGKACDVDSHVNTLYINMQVEGMGERRVKKNGWAMNSSTYCKNIFKCHNVLPPSTKIIFKKDQNQSLVSI
jgi:hypothetical protein